MDNTTPAGIALQLSVAVTLAGIGMAEQSVLRFEGTPDNTGPSRSVTEMICEALMELPHALVADHVLVIT